VPAAQEVAQGTQSTCVMPSPASVAVPVALQKPDLHAHAEMSAPPGEPFEFAGQAVQDTVWPLDAYVPVPQAVHESAPAVDDDCE
jgi:hypothetical protein